MSRCFPFPPPGYEKKPRTDHVDLLAKEKHKEKKHKKEKRDKENREGKDKKNKDRSKNKQREKKDRKEKHKDRKKDKDKSRSSEDRRTKEQTEGHHEDRFGECGQKAEEIKNFKFAEELGRRIKDEEKGMANRMAENFSCSIQRSIEKSNNVTVVQKKRVTDNETVSNSIGTMQRRNDGMGCSEDNFPSPFQRKIEGAGIAMQKERSTSNEMVPNSISSGQRGSTGMGRPAENTIHSIQRRPEGLCIATASEKERGASNKIISKPSVTVQRADDGMGWPAESLSGSSGSIQRKIDGVGLATAMEKEGGKVNESIRNHIITDQRGNDGTGKSVAKAAAKNIERKGKTKERGLDDGKGKKDQDCDEKKNKGKDKDRHKEKKKEENIRGKGEHKHKEHHKPRDSGKKNQIDSPNIKPLVPQKDNGNSAGTDENTKKRKDFEMNGFLHENDVRPNKFSRAAPSSHSPVENGRTQELPLVAIPCSSIEPVVINNTMAERVLEKIKDKRINSNAEAKIPSADSRHSVALGNGEKAKASLKPPHPDAKYLSQIYSVPKLEEWPESDDQEWLFSSDHLRPKPKMKLEADETPQVWAHTLQIESVDAIALPYVIPF